MEYRINSFLFFQMTKWLASINPFLFWRMEEIFFFVKLYFIVYLVMFNILNLFFRYHFNFIERLEGTFLGRFIFYII